jgi:hypothetical protein
MVLGPETVRVSGKVNIITFLGLKGITFYKVI